MDVPLQTAPAGLGIPPPAVWSLVACCCPRDPTRTEKVKYTRVIVCVCARERVLLVADSLSGRPMSLWNAEKKQGKPA